jgi:hypothetical protein
MRLRSHIIDLLPRRGHERASGILMPRLRLRSPRPVPGLPVRGLPNCEGMSLARFRRRLSSPALQPARCHQARQTKPICGVLGPETRGGRKNKANQSQLGQAGGRQKAEGRGRTTEDGGQRAEDGGRRTEGRGRTTRDATRNTSPERRLDGAAAGGILAGRVQ